MFVEAEELLVPDSPPAVEVVVVAILVLAHVLVEPSCLGEAVEAHAAVRGPVEEGRAVALAPQQTGQSVDAVVAIFADDVGHDKGRYRGQDGRHRVYRLAPVGEGVLEDV